MCYAYYRIASHQKHMRYKNGGAYMEYVYKSVKCPKCGKTTERNVSHSRDHYGCPLRVCDNCGSTYFDDSYIEKGLAEYSSKGGTFSITFIFWTIVSNLAVPFAIYLMLTEEFSGVFILMLVIFGALAVLCDLGLVKTIRNRSNSTEFHKKQLDLIEGRGGYKDEELACSMSRLSNREYLDTLKKCGVEIPDYFYERLNK